MDNDCPECNGYGIIVVHETGPFLEVELCKICDGDGFVEWFSNSCITEKCK